MASAYQSLLWQTNAVFDFNFFFTVIAVDLPGIVSWVLQMLFQ
tara:strand:- start:2085 stop:2213 length:129 start_codon:yes stop_codon:yes gene_type:complete